MKEKQFLKFLQYLKGDFLFFAPQKTDGSPHIAPINDLDQIDFSGNVPANTWKQLFFAHNENVFDFEKGIAESKVSAPATAAFGINVLDLRATTLYEHVFENDPYFQKRRNNTLIIGYSDSWPIDYKKYKVFSHDFEKDILRHLIFDIFVAKLKKDEYEFYSGTRMGQKFLEKYGISNFKNIEYAGSSPKTALDKKMLNLQIKVEKSFNKKVWKDLDKICIACGKCSIACPTCFCFDFEDKSDPQKIGRVRKWGNCFYNDFSQMAGGFKAVDSVKQKIYFWYTHKFVRIPREYKMPGCVSCGRCSKVCPVGIKINEVLKKL